MAGMDPTAPAAEEIPVASPEEVEDAAIEIVDEFEEASTVDVVAKVLE